MADICCISALDRRSRIILEYKNKRNEKAQCSETFLREQLMIVNVAKKKLMICGKMCTGDNFLMKRRQNLQTNIDA